MSAPSDGAREEAIARFWSRVRKSPEGCWEWTGSLHHGYGHYWNPALPSPMAYRVSYILVKGEIPEGLVLDHLCRVRSCVNPDHLEPVTYRENSRRSPLVLKDACAAGHRYEEGSYYLDRGVRSCKTCKKAAVAKYAASRPKTFVCEFCGETRSTEGRGKHIRKYHPEHYVPRPAPEDPAVLHERMLEAQRIRRRAASAARRLEREATR